MLVEPIPKPTFKKKPYPGISRAQRIRVYQRAGGTKERDFLDARCEWCGKPVGPFTRHQIHHKKITGAGGSRIEVPDSGLAFVCGECSDTKGHKLRVGHCP